MLWVAWIINTSSSRAPYKQIGMLYGDVFDEQDVQGRGKVAEVFHGGGRELLPEEQPGRVDLTDTDDLAEVPGWFSCRDRALVVSQAVHDVLQALEPGRHQIWPVTLTHKDQPFDRNPWFLLNIWRRVASVDHGASAVKMAKGFDRVERPKLEVRKRQVTLRPGAGEGAHLWRDDEFPDILVMSDTLADALEPSGALAAVDRFKTL